MESKDQIIIKAQSTYSGYLGVHRNHSGDRGGGCIQVFT